jgi:hypothetical protein
MIFTHFSKLLAVALTALVPALAYPQPPGDCSDNSFQCGDEQTPDKQTPSPNNDANQPTLGSKDRLFYALPNFLTVENADKLPPLTAGQKFTLQARSQFDYFEIPWYGILAGFSQARDTSAGYGQGAAGYGKRYASEWGDGSIENFMVAAVFASVLHQDPRFYQSGTGSFWRRVGYAVSRIVVTRSDSGQQVFNASEVFGSAVAAGTSTYTYHPRDERTVRNTLNVWGTQIGLDTFTLNVKEFWPDIRRKFSRKKQPDNASP